MLHTTDIANALEEHKTLIIFEKSWIFRFSPLSYIPIPNISRIASPKFLCAYNSWPCLWSQKLFGGIWNDGLHTGFRPFLVVVNRIYFMLCTP